MLPQGLSDNQVKESRIQSGSNKQKSAGKNYFLIIVEVIKEPMVLLLIVTCLFYFFMDQSREGIIMLFAITMVAGISVFQQIRSENAVATLNKFTKEPVTVNRNGIQHEIDSDELVCGDIMMISEGQMIYADASIVESNDFFVDESILTGESLSVDKNKQGESVFSGTTATSGMAWTQVTAVGSNTKIGHLGTIMDETIKEKTPLQIQVSNFVKKMTFFGAGAFVLVWISEYLLSGDVLLSLLNGLTLAMAVLPEEIPVAMATFMALGAFRLIKNDVLARHPQTVEALGAATVICIDKTGTITENKMTVSGYYNFNEDLLNAEDSTFSTNPELELLLYSMLASEDDPFDPMEKAIHEKYNEATSDKGQYTKTNEYPLSGKHPMMTHVFNDVKGNRIIACKGAPEGILERSGLSNTEIKRIEDALTTLASKGNRVLAVARGVCDLDELPKQQEDFKFEFLGLIALNDPPKKQIGEVINKFYEAGIEVKMITGDYPVTAMSIANKIGLKNNNKCITGNEIKNLEGEELKKAVKEFTIYARVMPEMKLKIVNCLKAMGEVVAMTGDGVNDGPALKAAHIGVAMGKRGSAIARKASSLVLINDDLSSMVTALRFGRNIYSNLKKAIQYIISIHIPLISIVTIPLLLNWKFPNLFSPVHVIFLELIMGPTCSIVYENEPINHQLFKIKPRKMSDSLFTWRELSRSVLQGLIIAAGILTMVYWLTVSGHTETYVRTMAFTALVLSNIMLTLSGRSLDKSILKTIRYKNNLMPIVIFITIILLAITLYINKVQLVFVFTELNPVDIIICFSVAVLSVGWIEVWKYFYYKNNPARAQN